MSACTWGCEREGGPAPPAACPGTATDAALLLQLPWYFRTPGAPPPPPPSPLPAHTHTAAHLADGRVHAVLHTQQLDGGALLL